MVTQSEANLKCVPNYCFGGHPQLRKESPDLICERLKRRMFGYQLVNLG
jgi:hypothetical protein